MVVARNTAGETDSLRRVTVAVTLLVLAGAILAPLAVLHAAPLETRPPRKAGPFAAWHQRDFHARCRDGQVPFEPYEEGWSFRPGPGFEAGNRPGVELFGKFELIGAQEAQTALDKASVDVYVGQAPRSPKRMSRSSLQWVPFMTDISPSRRKAARVAPLTGGGFTAAFSFRDCPYVLELNNMRSSDLDPFLSNLEPIHRFYPPQVIPGSALVFRPLDACGFGPWFRRRRINIDGVKYLTSAFEAAFGSTAIRSIAVDGSHAIIDFDSAWGGTGSCGAIWRIRSMDAMVFQFPHIQSVRYTTDGSHCTFAAATLHDGSCEGTGITTRADWERRFRTQVSDTLG